MVVKPATGAGPGSPGDVRRWRGQTLEQRAAGRRERLLAAALEVFTAQGFHATKVRDICRESGLTERYFYESFADKEALLAALAESIVTDFVAAAGPSLALLPEDLDGAIRGASHAVVTSMTDDPRRARIIFVEVVGVSPTIEQRRRELIGDLAGVVRAAAAGVLGPWALESMEVELLARALIGGAQELLIAYVRDEIELDQQVLVASITHLFERVRDALQDLAPRPERSST